MTIFVNILLAIAVLGVLGIVFGAVLSVLSLTDGVSSDACETEKASQETEEACIKLHAFVRCKGEDTEKRYTYVGSEDCFAASLLAGGPTACTYACIGLGTCVSACKFGAMSVENGVAVSDPEKCTGCGECMKVCPRGVIELIPENDEQKVQCSNRDIGSKTRKICETGCIGCFACVKNCEYGAIEVRDNLAFIDYSKCTQCGECAKVCPRGIITSPKIEEPEEVFDESEYFEFEGVAEEETAAEK